MKRLILALLSLACISPAMAGGLHPACNVTMPCQPMLISSTSFEAAKINMTRAQRRDAYRAARGRYLEERLPIGRAIVRPVGESSFGSYDLVERARAYMGGNPTGQARLWCGRFMAMIAPDAAARIRNPNMARDWAALPHVQARVGAIAVLSRGRRGGHVGVVSGFDAHGNPRIVSGNHGHRVGEGVYPAGRVLAYVSL